LFSIGTIYVPTLIRSRQHVSFISSTGLNLVEHVFVPVEPIYLPYILFDIPIKTIFVLLVQISIPPNILKQHLLKILFQLEVKKMEIDDTFACIRVKTFALLARLSLKKSN
jgi:hypothetical protein